LSWSFSSHTMSPSCTIQNFLGSPQDNDQESGGKAIVTFDLKTNLVLTANKQACKLFATDELKNLNMKNLFKSPSSSSSSVNQDVFTQSNVVTSQGDVIMSGKTFELKRNNGDVIPVSVWMRRLPQEAAFDGGDVVDDTEATSSINRQRCVAVIQPISRVHSVVTIDREGKVMAYDESFMTLFGIQNSDEAELNISCFIPAIQLTECNEDDEIINEQQLTGNLLDGSKFPLTAAITSSRHQDGSLLYTLNIWLYTTVAGVISYDTEGLIEGVNSNFACKLLGYTKGELKRKHISELFPHLVKPSYNQMTSPFKELQQRLSSTILLDENNLSSLDIRDEPSEEAEPQEDNTTGRAPPQQVTSTPNSKLIHRTKRITSIAHVHVKHKDSSMLPVICDTAIKQRKMKKEINLIWIYFDMNFVSEELNQSLTSTCAKTTRTKTLTTSKDGRLNDTTSTQSDDDDDDDVLTGDITRDYMFERKLGSGAFGFVKVGTNLHTNKQFAVKFIKKRKLLDEAMVFDPDYNVKIPLEIHLLTSLRHPNIVKALNFYECPKYYSFAMELHGEEGIDLFEFIDRQPRIDEKLASYIFRQIASAVNYLNRNRILHRDIKDENVIIDEKFTCKLIDFGSATYFKRHQKFDTFCGTMEYCSPEVLLGNKYSGPEAEIWALGVTLYTLVYGENPFADVDETIEAKLKPPSQLSRDLMELLGLMLQPSIRLRCDIQHIMMFSWTNLFVDIRDYDWNYVVNKG